MRQPVHSLVMHGQKNLARLNRVGNSRLGLELSPGRFDEHVLVGPNVQGSRVTRIDFDVDLPRCELAHAVRPRSRGRIPTFLKTMAA